MLFNSEIFIFLFLPAVFGVFTLISSRSHRLTVYWLLAASFAFYAWWEIRDTVLLVGSITGNFWMAKLIRRHRSLPLLSLTVAANLVLLGWFKYAGFFAQELSSALGTELPDLSARLPLGISFFTFHQITYLVSSYRDETPRHTGAEYALFVNFLPQLIAGPIVVARTLLPQISDRALLRFTWTTTAYGLSLFAIGLAKKVLLADSVAPFATPVFDAFAARGSLSLLEAWTGALAYTLQLYFDFSGYSDMALGLALLFGIRLPVNFDSPYKATSIIDFWRRWHISLSSFLRNYLYIPLGGNRHGAVRRYANLMIVMTLGGLWHGAGWTFILWGCLHGIFLIVNHGWRALVDARGLNEFAASRGWRFVAWAITLLSVCVAWVFFRANNLPAALEMLKTMAGMHGIALPDSYQAHLGGFAQVLEGLGVSFAPRAQMPHLLGLPQWSLLGGTLLLALFAPNSQTLCLEQEGRRAAWFWLRPLHVGKVGGWLWVGFILVLTSWSIAEIEKPTEFLYFNF
jgi:D-alanyl-lipoteichoic acid acyltransferase DltB (MBOAT superfamily)